MSGAGVSDASAQPCIGLRELRADDAAFLREVYAGTRMQELSVLDWSREQVDAFIDLQFEAQRRHYWAHYDTSRFHAITVDGADAGRLYVERRERELRVVDIALLPPFRNRGVATRLFRELFDEADRDGLVVSIHVEHDNPAQRLYQRLGFAFRDEPGGMYRLMERPSRLGAAA